MFLWLMAEEFTATYKCEFIPCIHLLHYENEFQSEIVFYVYGLR